LFETNVTVAFYAGHTKTIDAHEARGVHLPSLSIYWTKNYSVLPWNLHFDDKDTAERMANAFRHAIAQLKKNQPF
jgi:predicted class III extradiol MEMO1 family dioxygenase